MKDFYAHFISKCAVVHHLKMDNQFYIHLRVTKV